LIEDQARNTCVRAGGRTDKDSAPASFESGYRQALAPSPSSLAWAAGNQERVRSCLLYTGSESGGGYKRPERLCAGGGRTKEIIRSWFGLFVRTTSFLRRA